MSSELCVLCLTFRISVLSNELDGLLAVAQISSSLKNLLESVTVSEILLAGQEDIQRSLRAALQIKRIFLGIAQSLRRRN